MLLIVIHQEKTDRNERFRQISVVLMTISRAEEDIPDSYNLNSIFNMTKPIGLKQYSEVVKSIEDLRISIAKILSLENWSQHMANSIQTLFHAEHIVG